MGDRRKIERFKLRLPARLDVVGRYEDVQQATLSLETDNVCSGGAYFTTLSPLPQGTSVKIDLLLGAEFTQLRDLAFQFRQWLFKWHLTRHKSYPPSLHACQAA